MFVNQPDSVNPMNRDVYLLVEGALGGLALRLCAHQIKNDGSNKCDVIREVFVGSKSSVSSSLPSAFEQVCGDEWPEVRGVVVSRGPGSYTSIRAVLAFIYGIQCATESHLSALKQKSQSKRLKRSKRWWIGVSSLAMIMASVFHGEENTEDSDEFSAAKVSRPCGVFLVQGHRKGYLCWAETAGKNRFDSAMYSEQVDIIEWCGRRYYTISASYMEREGDRDMQDQTGWFSLSSSLEWPDLTDLLWIEQKTHIPTKKSARSVPLTSDHSARPRALVMDSVQDHHGLAMVVSLDNLNIHSLSMDEALSRSLIGMTDFLSSLSQNSTTQSDPPQAVYLRDHYAGVRS